MTTDEEIKCMGFGVLLLFVCRNLNNFTPTITIDIIRKPWTHMIKRKSRTFLKATWATMRHACDKSRVSKFTLCMPIIICKIYYSTHLSACETKSKFARNFWRYAMSSMTITMFMTMVKDRGGRLPTCYCECKNVPGFTWWASKGKIVHLQD